MSVVSPPIGQAMELAPGVRRIIAPNASPMTFWGTNTYLLGQDELMVLDPGPDDPAHLSAILKAAKGAKISHVVVTHSHLDHSPLAQKLSRKVDASIYAFGDSSVGKTEVMTALEATGLSGGGEGVDRSFAPDQLVAHGEMIKNADVALRALHTPGHMGNHISLEWEDVVFTGDLVMGWASTMVSPPDGDLGDFLASCGLLRSLNARRFFPGHGDPIEDPNGRIDWLVEHRNDRTQQIMNALSSEALDIQTITSKIYTDAPKGLLAAAARNVFAHLIHLESHGKVKAIPALHPDATYGLKNN